MKTVCLTIRGCPDELHSKLKEAATREGRSLNSQALVWMEEQAQTRPKRRPSDKALMRRIQAIKWTAKATRAEVDAWRQEGRP